MYCGEVKFTSLLNYLLLNDVFFNFGLAAQAEPRALCFHHGVIFVGFVIKAFYAKVLGAVLTLE